MKKHIQRAMFTVHETMYDLVMHDRDSQDCQYFRISAKINVASSSSTSSRTDLHDVVVDDVKSVSAPDVVEKTLHPRRDHGVIPMTFLEIRTTLTAS